MWEVNTITVCDVPTTAFEMKGEFTPLELLIQTFFSALTGLLSEWGQEEIHMLGSLRAPSCPGDRQ